MRSNLQQLPLLWWSGPGFARSVGPILVVALTYGLASSALIFTRDVDRIAAAWPVNAVLVAVLMRSPAHLWPRYLLAGLGGNFLANLHIGDTWRLALTLAGCNGVEILLCAGLMRRLAGQSIDFSQRASLLLFLAVGGVLAPAVSALLAAAILLDAAPLAYLTNALNWYVPDALGLVIVTPALLALTRDDMGRLGRRLREGRGWASILTFVAALLLVFPQNRYPVFFLLPPALIFVAFELDLAGAALALLIGAVVSVVMTLTGHGPAMLISDGMSARLAVLQIFLATLTLSVLPIAVSLAGQHRLRQRLASALTDAQHVQERLTEAHRLSGLAEAIGGIGYWRRDLATSKSTWSSQMYSIHGFDEQQGPDEPVQAMGLYYPEDQARLQDAVRRATLTGEPFDLKVRLRRADDGCERQVVFRGEVERDADGRPIALFGVMRDITDEETVKASLAESEARFRLLAESATDILIKLDLQLRITYASPSIRRYGYEPEAVIGALVTDYIHAEDLSEELERERAKVISSGGAYVPGEGRSLRMRKADGDYVWIESNASAVCGDDGTVRAILCQLRDVSKRRAAIEALSESEARYRLLTDNATDVIACYGVDGLFSFLSPSLKAVTGYEPHELVGRPTSIIMHPDDVVPINAQFRAYFDDGAKEAIRFEYRAIRKDGQVIWLEAQAKAVFDPDSGRIIEFEDVVRDITARKAVEVALEASNLRYRVISQNTTDIVSRTDNNGIVLQLSPSIRAVMGYAAEEVVGRNWVEFLHPDDVAPSLAIYRNIVLGTREDNQPIVYRVRHSDGRWIWLESNPTPLRDAHGAVAEFIDVTRDVSGRARLEAELRAARNAAVAAAAVKSDFMANMSHEIRTPLTAILGFTSLVADDETLSPAGRERLGRIQGAGETLLSIVNDVLDFSKLEAGQFDIVPEPMDPGAVLSEALWMFSPQAQAKGLVLRFEPVEPLPPCVALDKHRLRQILHNLIGNAIKFTEAGHVALQVRYDDKRQRLHVAVDDTGPGMNKAQRAKLFQRFSQVDASSTRRHGGTGLGLAICKGLTEAMDGKISVLSRLGLGSTFRFEVAAPLTAFAEVAEANPETIGLYGARLLVVDDNLVNRELVRAILSPLGVEVTAIADGEAALAQSREEPFDILLLDARMPGLSGPEVAARIRAEQGPNSNVPILAFTADVDILDLVAAGSDFDGVIRKPIAPANLLTTLAAHLAWNVQSEEVTDVAAV